MPSSVMFIINCRKSFFSHSRMQKFDSKLVVLAESIFQSTQNIRKCSKHPFSSPHPVLQNVVWSCLSMRSLEPCSLCDNWASSTTRLSLRLYRYLIIDSSVITENTSNDTYMQHFRTKHPLLIFGVQETLYYLNVVSKNRIPHSRRPVVEPDKVCRRVIPIKDGRPHLGWTFHSLRVRWGPCMKD